MGAISHEQRDAHYAVVVGIDHYVYDSVLRPLNGASADARRFVEWLLDEAGGALRSDQVRALATSGVRVDTFDSPPIQEVLLWHVIRALGQVNQEMLERIRNSEPGVYERSRLYIFFAGHGVMAPNVQAALLTSEAGTPGAFGWGVNVTDLAQWYFDHGPFKQVICFADCCRTYYKDIRFNSLNLDAYQQAGLSPSWILRGFATLPNEASLERFTADEVRGVFSNALVDALQADVDPQTGCIDHESLKKAVGRRVHERTLPPGPPPPQASVFIPGEMGYNEFIYFGGSR